MRWRVHTLVRMAMLLGLAACFTAFTSPSTGQTAITPDSLTDAHVQKAIDALVETLHARKDPQRLWDPERVPSGESKRQGGGYTALAVLALLYAGQSYQDPRLRDAVEYLEQLEMQGTYALTTRAMLWAKLPPRFQDKLAADARVILDGFNERTGGWDYVPNPRANYHDNSIRQFGALALWEAAKRDAKVDPRVWKTIEDTFVRLQRNDGGWNYKDDDPSTGSMTAAGLATLFITQDLLHAADHVKLGDRQPTAHQQAIDKGMQWMDKRYSSVANPGKDSHFFYYMYGVERVGLASGYSRFGGRDWFREGAVEIIDRLLKWDPKTESFTPKSAATAANSTDELSFAIMFLSRGRVPVACNKLRFDGAWNNRPRDVANLTRWIGETTESALNWQIVDLSAMPESWLDAPVLYIASHEPLPWIKSIGDINKYVREWRAYNVKRVTGTMTAEDVPPAAPTAPELTKLKTYLDSGAMIFAANEGTLRRFADSIEEAGQWMYPQYDWRNLPDDHWAYTTYMPVKGRRPLLRGLSNGVRELIILSPGGDLPATFQQHDLKQQGFYQTLANVYAYASDMNRARPRVAQHRASLPTPAAALNAVTVVRAMYDGPWNAEPRALEHLAQHLSAKHALRMNMLDHPLVTIHQLMPPPSLVIISGTDAHTFSQDQINAIKSYTESGGTILFETSGGRGAFTTSAEEMASAAFGAEIVSANSFDFISGKNLDGAVDAQQVNYRAFALQTFGVRETAPRLRAMIVNAQHGPQLLYSREDLLNGLLDQPRWGISGYSPASARDLLANIVLYAMRQTAPSHSDDEP